jgi:site-specific recombinase XerD
MKLAELVSHYLASQHALGMRYRTQAVTLKAFCHAMGDCHINDVQADDVQAFIAGQGPVTAFWHHKYRVLDGFYRFAITRGFTPVSPLPTTVPKCPPALPPYIYSVEELRRLLAATEGLQTARSSLQAYTFRTLLLLLYGTGMRIGEALALTLADVQLQDCLLTVRDAKFYKTRWVPTGPQLTAKLAAYATQRRRLPLPVGTDSAFLATRTGHHLSYVRASQLFRRVRQDAGIHREPGARYQPRLHDLRHTAAVHRLIAWYRNGADVQRLLPHLSTYLGHVGIASTQRYLTMTPELLAEASHRFEHYAHIGDLT